MISAFQNAQTFSNPSVGSKVMTINAKGGICWPARILTDFPYTIILAKMGQNYPKIAILGPKMLKIT